MSSSERRLKRVRFRPAPLKSSRSSTFVSLRTKQPTVFSDDPSSRRPFWSSFSRIADLSLVGERCGSIECSMISRRGWIR
jgi:hypothetical protein